LSWTGKNDGSVTTGSSYWYDRVVFSKNQIFGDSDDVYLNETYIYSAYGLPLEPQETYTASLNVTLPGQAFGDGYLLFKTDNYNYQGETNENDNVYSQAITIEAPNLTITSATAPIAGILGGSIAVSWTVLNNGTVSANADWYDSVYLSNDQTWDSGDTWINAFWEAARSPLAANTSYTDTRNITIPSGAGIGAKYLIFVTDQYSYSYYNQQAETNETDNAYVVPITLGAPDLVISGATAPSSGIVNGSINVSWTVKNQGTTDAPADWYDVIYLSTDNIFGNGNDSYITEQYISTQTPLAANGSYTINRDISLSNVTPGNYYIYVHTDAYNYQGETNNNNNYSQAFAITIGAPDLIVSNVTAPEAGALGETVSLSWTVQNQGTVEAPADWTDYIYWSSNDTYDGSDTFITSISAAAQTPVAAGGTYSKTQSFSIPNQINFVGNGYLIVRADGNNAQGETNESNNNRAIPIRIDAPDLIVSNATAPASVTVGATIGVTWDVKNQGAVAANADWYDRVVISTDQVFGNSDDTYLTEVWQGSLTPLAAGATYSRTLNVTLPSTATGDRYLLFKADNYNYQGEIDENNNVYSVPINISASDLQITATSAPSTAILGETVELTWTVTNNGTGAASQDWYDRVFLSNNQTLDGGDVQVTSELIGSQTPLAAGASYTISKNVTLPSFAPGNQYLLIVADRDNYQGEISENNNLAAVAISLTAPDLIVSNASVPASGTVGKSIEVSWTVQNQGTSAAPTDWYDRIYLSNDAVFDANADTYITQDLISTQTPLAAGASYSTTRNINLPNFATGNRYLIFVADGSGSQGETNESNNIRAAAINLNAPDLIVSDITAPVESLSGQPIEINWTVKNQGATTAEGTWYDYVYLLNTATNSTQYVGVFEYSGSLAAGASLNRTQSYSVPLSLTGNYRVVVTTDYYGQIAEGTQNESNNTTTDDRPISLQLAPVPNLQVTGVTAPSTAFSSQETVVQWTVKNVGTGATNAPVWYDHVYLSLDTTYDNTDTYLGQAVNPSYLNPDDSYSNSLTVTLPRGIDSNYYFLVQADAYNYVAEVGNEGDNWGSGGPTDVNLTPPPDLQVTAVNAPNGAFSGQPMNLSWTVTNAGTGRTLETAWYDRVIMSADATLDADDRILGNFYHGGALNAGANYTGSATVNLPIGVAGNFFFFVQSDIYNQVYEYVFENNNSGYDTTATNITLTPPPDLEFEYLTIPNNARSGNNLSISYRVTNFGATETPTSYWTDTFYLSSDNQLNTTTDIILGSAGQYGILYPGDGYDRTANFTLPNTLTGTYYVFGVTDSGDQVFELNNINNVTQSINQVQIVAQPADLVVTDAVIPTTGEAGKAISVQWTINNQGTGDTIVNSWSDRLVASTDGVLGDADDLTLASFTRTGLLAPNGTYSRTESVILPFTLEGNYQLFVVTDSANSVYEGGNEGNNGSSAFPLTISRDTPDLQVTSITLPNIVTPGQPLILNWTVANLGVGRTNSNYWYDQVYLSLDKNVSSSDISLGSVYRAGALEPSASYAATGTFSLPVNLNGSYYVLVHTDRDNIVIEGAFENNNIFASDSSSGGGSGIGAIPITPAPSADLAVSAVDAPGQGIAGQTLSLTWTVVNNDANTAQSWYDAVYLSRDQVFDRNSDIYLGYRTHTGGLAAGDSYTATQSFSIPRGLAGRFYAFVVTDGANAVYERLGEINNVSYDGFSTEIILPPPVDLAVGTITVPVNGIPGQNATISYTVTNLSTNEAIGTWEDTIYLSSDNQWDANDAFFGRVSQTGPVAGSGSYSKTVTAALPGVATGDYNVIVRSDIRNYIPESNEANNIKASLDDFAVDVESLELGTPDTGTLGQGQSVYYRVDVPAGETLLLSFDSQSTAAANELYIRYGDIPSRGQFDIGYSQPFTPDQEIVIPNTRGGTYYVLAYGDNVTGGTASYNIEAELLEFSLRDIGTTKGSNKGKVTLNLEGAKLTPTTTAKLISTDGTERIASQIIWKDSTETWATFDLQGLETGVYDVHIQDDGKTFSLEDTFTVTSGATGQLETRLIAPTALRPGQSGIVTVEYANTGETDIIAPLMTLTADNAALHLSEQAGVGNSSIQFLAINQEGHAGILSPGARGRFSFTINPIVTNGTINFSLSEAIENETIDWSIVKTDLQPPEVSNEAWNIIWNNFTAAVGDTAGSYQKELANNATYLSQLGESTGDISRLVAFELRQASNQLLGPTLVSTIDATAPTPGLKLEFSRIYSSSIDGRFSLSSFGRGWTHQWNINAITDGNDNVTIHDYDSTRLFSKQADGSYRNQAGDGATLTQASGTYRLQEQNGTVVTFSANGNLNYVQDINGNQITTGYTGGQLISLVHSNGDSFTLSYNNHGHISQLTDQAGRTTTYSYDASGEALLSVTNAEGTISYTYETSEGTASEHALRSITNPGGLQTLFDYDNQGRLIRQSRDGGAKLLTYTYDSAGEIIIADNAGFSSQLLVNDQGATGQIQDPLGQVTQFQYDVNGYLTKLVAPDNTVQTFTYDNRGNLLSSLDASGNQIKFTYDLAWDKPLRFKDQRGNTIGFGYDNQGNLQSIAYADGSTETYSYDSLGNLSVAVNRRNQTIEYTYDNRGLLTRKDYEDGISATFTYDSLGNLLSAIDDDSTVAYSYDHADRLTKVTYNSSRFLEFTYDASDRRTRMEDQDGFAINYVYDSLGQLQDIKDGAGISIISYTYDSVGRLVGENNGNGSYSTYSYDRVGQILSLVNYQADGSINSQFDYAYDAVGRRTSVITLEGTTNYGYDAIGQLTTVTLPSGQIIEYRYDAAGNRIRVTDNGAETAYKTNNLNQYTSVGAATYTYDTDGNLIAKIEGGSLWTYTYDSENRLIGAATPEGTWTYEYNALGNRIASVHNGQRTEYVLDPTGLVDVFAEYNGTGNLIARYISGLGLVSRVDGTNSTSYYDADALGSIVGLTGTNGNYINYYSYLPFGEDLTKVEAISNPFEYVGQWGVIDEGSGLDFMLNRYYDSDTGRFVSEDPVGLLGGDTNIRRYVQNNPVNEVDPLGLGYWAKRPLQGLPWLGPASSNPLDDYYNSEISHEHYIFDDGTNIGFGPNGRFSESDPNTLSKYRRASGDYDDSIMREAMKNVNDKPYWVIPFDPDTDNCQEWAERVREEYERIKKEREREKGQTNIIRPSDPNDIVGPAGFGNENWIAPQTLPYTIRFENQASATAPAQTVTITHPLDSDLDFRTFRLGSFGWSGLTFNVPENRSFYNQRVDLTEEYGFLVDIFAGIDIQKGEAFWTLTTIDPETGETPENPLIGFLPPNNDDGVGDGFVAYSIRPSRTAETGDILDAVATIIFDTEEPISTPPIFNTLDVDKPSSEVNDLPATTATPEFLVSWAGADVGAALASYTVYVSDNGGPYLPWLQDTTLTESNYAGTPGHLYRFIAVAKDNAGNIQVLPQEAQATIFVQGEVNQPPSAVALTNVTTSLAENSSTTSRVKVADIAISDDALGTNTISLLGADAAAFEVEGTVLYLKAGTSLDYETKAAYAVTVSVSDSTVIGSSPASTGYSLSITDVNEAPSAVELTNVTASLAENTSTTSRIKVADIAISDDALGTNTNALSGADAAAFEVEGTVLYLKAGTSLDYETKAAYAVTVSVSDAALSGSSPVSTGYSLSITDVNEAPTAVALTNVTASLAENSSTTSRIKVADIAISDDALGTNTISLLGADASAFEVEGTVLYLKAGTSLDYETKAAYAVTVSVSDAALSGSSPVSTGYSLSITDVNEAPTAVALSNVTASLAENSSTTSRIKVADIAISDDALGTNTISLLGADAAAFEVEGTVLYLKAGTSLDYETKAAYAVTVSVSDATLSGSSPVSTGYSLSITDVNEAPTAVALTNVTASLAENSSTASRIKLADIAISDDALGSNTIALSGADAAAFEVEGTVLYLKAGTSLDYETKAAYAVTVSVSDATLSGSSPVSTGYSLSITDVNEAPTAVALTNVTASLAENSSTASRIKVADIAISDDALGTNSIALSGADAAAFEVEGTVLYLKAGTSLDYETKAAYAVTVSVSDAALSGSSPVSTGYSLSITDVNEAPTAVALTNVTASLAENSSTASRIKVADIAISDDALGTNSIALSGADAAAFEVDGTVLYLKAGTSLDYETKAAYAVSVSVSDAALSGSNPVSTGYNLSITDVNEVPTAVALTNVTTSLPENSSTTSRIKVADIAISDDALGSNTIALSGADAAAFEVDGTVLYLKAGTSLDYETKAAYAITVSVSDAALSGSSPVSTGYNLSITDVNEAPTAVALTNATASLAENSSTTSRIKLADIAISDDALGTNSIALSGADAAAFEVEGTVLYLKAGTSLDYETKAAYAVTVSVSDSTISGASAVTANYSLAVTDRNEAPTALALSATSLNENIPAGALVASLSSSDPDTSPQSFSYALVGGAGDTDNLAFFVTGDQLHITRTPDYEVKSSYGIRLRTTDQGGLSFERHVQLAVNDLPDFPSYSFSSSAPIVYEGGALALGISSSNVAPGSQIYWSFSGTGITSADIGDGSLSGTSALGGDGGAGFTKTIAADGVVEGDEGLEVKFFSDSARTQQLGITLLVTIKEPSVGVVTDGPDVITGTAAAETIRGVPTGSTLRGLGTVDKLTGGAGNDTFVLADASGVFYDDGNATASQTKDMAWITDFSAGDKIILSGSPANYRLSSAFYSSLRGVLINALLPSSTPEPIGFVQSATLASLSLANLNQFTYLNAP
jgi:RHS repeat-associated protein